MNKKLRIIILCILAISVIGMLSYIYFFDYKNNNNIENNPPEEQNNTNNNPIDNNPTDKPVNNNIKVTQVTLNITDASMHVGDTLNLVANVLPSTATNKTVTWDSSNKDVATVSNGKVTAIKAGNVTIYAKADDGQKMALCMIKVLEKTVTNIPVNSITLNKTTLSLYTGDSESLIANVLPNDATDKTVIWTSSNPGVAVVSGGKVTAVKAGTTTINATTKDGGKKATCTVTVTTKIIKVTSVSLSNISLSLLVGDVKTIRAYILPEEATNQNVTWTSSNPSVATVDNGKITAKSVGTTIVTVITVDGQKTANCTVTVSKKSIDVISISLTNTTLSMDVGDSKTINAIINPTDATNQSISWISSNPSVATVDNGKITAIKEGTTKITATSVNGKMAICDVTVNKKVVVDQKDRLYSIDTGFAGNAILLESNGKYALIDAGAYYSKENCNAHLFKYLKNMGVTHLEFIIATHMHYDHVSCIGGYNGDSGYLVDNGAGISVGKVIMKKYNAYDSSHVDQHITLYNNIINKARSSNIPIDYFSETNRKLTLGDFTINLYNGEERLKNAKGRYSENSNSIVTTLAITKNGKTMLTYLAGDIQNADTKVEEIIAKKIVSDNYNQVFDLYVAAHHGYENANTTGAIGSGSDRLQFINTIVTNTLSWLCGSVSSEASAEGIYNIASNLTRNNGSLQIRLSGIKAVVVDYSASGLTISGGEILNCTNGNCSTIKKTYNTIKNSTNTCSRVVQ